MLWDELIEFDTLRSGIWQAQFRIWRSQIVHCRNICMVLARTLLRLCDIMIPVSQYLHKIWTQLCTNEKYFGKWCVEDLKNSDKWDIWLRNHIDDDIAVSSLWLHGMQMTTFSTFCKLPCIVQVFAQSSLQYRREPCCYCGTTRIWHGMCDGHVYVINFVGRFLATQKYMFQGMFFFKYTEIPFGSTWYSGWLGSWSDLSGIVQQYRAKNYVVEIIITYAACMDEVILSPSCVALIATGCYVSSFRYRNPND